MIDHSHDYVTLYDERGFPSEFNLISWIYLLQKTVFSSLKKKEKWERLEAWDLMCLGSFEDAGGQVEVPQSNF